MESPILAKTPRRLPIATPRARTSRTCATVALSHAGMAGLTSGSVPTSGAPRSRRAGTSTGAGTSRAPTSMGAGTSRTPASTETPTSTGAGASGTPRSTGEAASLGLMSMGAASGAPASTVTSAASVALTAPASTDGARRIVGPTSMTRSCAASRSAASSGPGEATRAGAQPARRHAPRVAAKRAEGRGLMTDPPRPGDRCRRERSGCSAFTMAPRVETKGWERPARRGEACAIRSGISSRGRRRSVQGSCPVARRLRCSRVLACSKALASRSAATAAGSAVVAAEIRCGLPPR